MGPRSARSEPRPIADSVGHPASLPGYLLPLSTLPFTSRRRLVYRGVGRGRRDRAADDRAAASAALDGEGTADRGLSAALEAQARKAAVPTTVEADGVGRYEEQVEAAVYFCTLEALQNVAKYAKASGATVHLSRKDGHLDFEVADDGVGFDPNAKGSGTGTQGMADRLAALGGELLVVSSPGAGTTVTGKVPVAAPEPRAPS